MKTAYIAGPLFNESERELNFKIDEIARRVGYETYLPQRDGGEAAKIMRSIKRDGSIESDIKLYEARGDIFLSDVEAIKNCDIMIVILDGRVPDEGTMVELGMAYALGKTIIAYSTDDRSFIDGFRNIMVEFTINDTIDSKDELQAVLKELING